MVQHRRAPYSTESLDELHDRGNDQGDRVEEIRGDHSALMDIRHTVVEEFFCNCTGFNCGGVSVAKPCHGSVHFEPSVHHGFQIQ